MGNEAGRLFGVEAISFRVPSGTAPGFRDRANGGLSRVGNGGFSWSSDTTGIGGMYLTFDVTTLVPSHVDIHGYGFQLRCLSE